jgi:hypothetical protein
MSHVTIANPKHQGHRATNAPKKKKKGKGVTGKAKPNG